MDADSQYVDSDLKKIFVYLATGAFGALLAGNLFFVTRLISRLETVVDEVWNLRQQITILSYRVDEIQNRK